MPGLLRGIARTAAIAGTATAVSNRVSRRQGERWAQQSQQQAQAQAPQQPVYSPPAPEAEPVDRMAELSKLGELKTQGILTEAEFEAEKARILAS
ncbi:MAG TPA: SHOCT domain-containing protein [Microthrixaceae bacterium]|nr:SHOCT domain-containing protein [Microthrixaceae bacterium]